MNVPAELPREVRRFAQRLMAARIPAGQLAPLEERLLAVMRPLFSDCLMFARIGRMAPGADLPPVTEDLIAEGARFAVVAAVEIEQHLRQVRRRLEDAGAEIEVARAPELLASLERLGSRQIGSLLLEGGAILHAVAWDEGLADFVRVYVTPHRIGSDGIRFLEGRDFDPTRLLDRRVESLGPDVLMEGYVHGLN